MALYGVLVPIPYARSQSCVTIFAILGSKSLKAEQLQVGLALAMIGRKFNVDKFYVSTLI